MTMPALKYSRQRESIKLFLMNRKDHPTADMVYVNMREKFPHISLGTVYRNLSLLAELGEITKVSTGGAERFDANREPHYHFICRRCQAVLDMELPLVKSLEAEAARDFDGTIQSHTATFYGICPQCMEMERKENNSSKRY